MKDRYFSAKEVAGLPGMPETDRHVRRIADSEKWPFQKRPGKGGGKEYLESSLPALTQRALAAKRKIQAAKKARIDASQEMPKTFYIMIDGEVFEVRKL